MEKYKTELLKLIVIAFMTPVLVMLYTTIEKRVAGVKKSEYRELGVFPKPLEENRKTVHPNDYILATTK